ncbi:MAG: hypothetical protein ABFR33_03135, partial [Verrucomicrobiota bacterium]
DPNLDGTGQINMEGSARLIVNGDQTGTNWIANGYIAPAIPGESIVATYDSTNARTEFTVEQPLATVLWDDGFEPPTSMWDDDFSAGTLNTNWSVYAPSPSSVTQTGGQLIMDTGGTTDALLAAVYTLTDEAGTVTTYNGAQLYDFYDHQVSTRFDIASMAGTPDGPDQRNTFICRFGDVDATDYIEFRLEHLIYLDDWRLMYAVMDGGVYDNEEVAYFDGLPTALTYALNGTNASIQVEGANITVALPNWIGMVGSIDDLSAGIADYYIAYGARNFGTPTAQTVVTLEDVAIDVTTGGFNPNWTVSANGPGAAVSQAGGQMVMDSGSTADTAWAAVGTLTDETGTMTTIGGAPLYDFYNHKTSIRFDIANITASLAGANNRNSFYCSIGDDVDGYFYPNHMDKGVSFVLEHLDYPSMGALWRLIVWKSVAGTPSAELEAWFSGLPTALSYTLDGTNTTIDVEGATVINRSGWDLTHGDTRLLGGMTDLSANISGYTLAFGAYNLGAVAAQTVVSLDAFTAKVFENTFATWAGTWGVEIGSELDDYDGDSIENLGEYGLGGDPTDDADQGLEPTFESDGGGNMVYIHAQRTDDQNLTYWLETTTDMIVVPWVDSGYSTGGTNVTGGLFDYVTNTVPNTADKTFIRLRVQNN